MAQADRGRINDRVKATIGVAAFHGLVGYAFLYGLGFDVVRNVSETMKVFNVAPEPPPPPPIEPVPAKVRIEEPEGAAAPPSRPATPVVAPKPKVVLKVPSPIVAAPKPGTGSDRTPGNSTVAGTGTGTGGTGNGTGSGGFGNGTGGGGVGAKALRIRGGFTRNDYARLARGAPLNVSVAVSFTVQTDGSVRGCVVTRSSGRADVDSTTCRLIQQRFYYTPARDPQGRPIPAILSSTFYWEPR